MHGRRRVALALAICGCALPAGCGASGDTVVVRVGQSSITRPTLAHWIALEAVASHEERPKPPTPKGLIPVPPAYTACIALLGRQADPTKAKPTVAELEHECEVSYYSLRNRVLEKLITYFWMGEEAKQKGIEVSDEEVDRVLRSEFPASGELKQYLEATGASMADERMNARRMLLSEKLQDITPLSAIGFAGRLVAKWAPRTDCSHGYVMVDCRQYRGPRE